MKVWMLKAAELTGTLPKHHDAQTAWVDKLFAAATKSTHVLKHSPRSRVIAVDYDHHHWAVKRYSVTGLKGWLYSRLKRTPAWREWNGARQLRRARVRAVMPLALVEHDDGAWRQSIVMPFYNGLTLNYYVKNGGADAAQRRLIAWQVGRQIGQMIAAGIVNRDHKASNLIVDDLASAGQAPPLIIDPAGLRKRRGDAQVCKMLALLYITASKQAPVSDREAITVLREVLRTDGAFFAKGKRRFRRAFNAVLKHIRKDVARPHPEK